MINSKQLATIQQSTTARRNLFNYIVYNKMLLTLGKNHADKLLQIPTHVYVLSNLG